MSEIPDKNKNFNSVYSDFLTTGESYISSDTISFTGSGLYGGMSDQSYWENDGISLTGNPSPIGEDHITLNPPSFKNQSQTQTESQNHFWKFGEGKTLKAVEDYIVSTYKAHYASDSSKVQVLDIIDAIGDGVPFCRDNLIKYSSRFGKKDGMSRLDALKIIHYGILLYNFAGFNNETSKSNYETF